MIRSIIDNKQCGERPGNPCGSGRPTCECPNGQSFRLDQFSFVSSSYDDDHRSAQMDNPLGHIFVWSSLSIFCTVYVHTHISSSYKCPSGQSFRLDQLLWRNVVILYDHHHTSAPMDSCLGLFTIIYDQISDIIKYHHTFFTYNCSPRELRNLLKELAQG